MKEKDAVQEPATEVTSEVQAAPEAKPEKKADKKQSAKAKKEKKPNWFVRTGKRIGKWLHELRLELKKVVWPTRKEVLHNTLVVIACVLVVGVCIWVFDWLSAAVIRALINLFAG
ncbi:MAG: preprotein translocase subunit SecE [Clostridiales bacterium]|nr:preprotein translocase subunit SecE [Clostridiales bacterium]